MHTVAEGLFIKVDDQWVKTPHTELWPNGSVHSVAADDNGIPFPGNDGWVWVSPFSTGAMTTSISPFPNAAGQLPCTPLSPPPGCALNGVFTVFPPDVLSTGTFYGHVTASIAISAPLPNLQEIASRFGLFVILAQSLFSIPHKQPIYAFYNLFTRFGISRASLTR